MTFEFENNLLSIIIQDDGKGMSQQQIKGKGLYTLKKRIAACQGTIAWQNMNPGLAIKLIIHT